MPILREVENDRYCRTTRHTGNVSGSDRRKSVEAVVADTVTVKRILPNIITKMNLPMVGPDGQPMSYSLDHKEGGRRLHEHETLVQANVGTGDHLIVYPEIVAG